LREVITILRPPSFLGASPFAQINEQTMKQRANVIKRILAYIDISLFLKNAFVIVLYYSVFRPD
jgi:hypothetical protein